jgi:PTS system mannose-specific IIA component
VEVLTGVNLPMMVKFPIAREGMPLGELARQLQECGQRSITIPGDMLKKKAEKREEK